MAVQCECTICKKQFESNNFIVICPECTTSEQKVFEVVRNFLYDHHGASVNEVVNGTGLSASVILNFLRQGRIETTGDIKLIQCEECGAPINYGKLCSTCENSKLHQFTSASKLNTGRTKNTMYTKTKK